MNSKVLIVLVLALLACGASALRMRSIINNNINDVITNYEIKGTPFNGSVPLGTLIANKWNQTSFALSSTLSNVPLTSIWLYFSDTNTGKPIPSTYFQRASLTLTTSNGDLSTYNALTSSLGVSRSFPSSSPYVIPAGNLTLKVTYALADSVPPTNASVSWVFVQGTASANTLEHATVFLPGWKGTGVTTGSVTTAIPYDGIITFAVGNVLVGGQSVTLLNNATGAVICTSPVTATGDMTPCTLNVQIAKGSKITVVVKSNSTGVANNGGMDLYIEKVVPVTTAATTSAATTGAATSGAHATAATSTHAASTHAATSTHAAATHAAATSGNANSGHANSGNSNSGGHSTSGANNGGNSGGNSGHSGSNSGHSGSNSGGNSGGNSGNGNSGQTTSSASSGNGNSAASNGVTMGYSSGSSGSSGSSSGTGGFFEGEKAIFQMKQKPTKEIKSKGKKNPKEVTLNDLKRKAMNMNDEVDETEESEDHFRVFEEKSSQKFF